MYSQEIEVDYFPHAFSCVCGRPLLVKASEQGQEITCGGCRHVHMPLRLKKRETPVASPNKLPVPDDQTGKSATLAGDSDVTLVFQTSPSNTRWMKRLVILVIAAALTYALYPWIIREPKVYGIGGLRGRLNDMFELIEWDENRILATMIMILVVIMGFIVKTASSEPRPASPVLLGGVLAFGITAICLSLALMSMVRFNSLAVSVAVPYMQFISKTITKEYGTHSWMMTFLFLLSCVGNTLAGCAIGSLFTSRKARLVGGWCLVLGSLLPMIQSFTLFASRENEAGMEWLFLSVVLIIISVCLFLVSRSPSKTPSGEIPSV